MSNYLAEQYFIEATELINCWSFADAKKKLEEIIEVEPGYGRAHYQLGWLYFYKFRDYETANYHLRLAIKLSPEFPTTYYTYAYLLNEINHPVALQKHAAKALTVRGIDTPVIYNELAKSFELNGNYSEAICHYRKALKFTLCHEQIGEIEKHIERVKMKSKTFDSNTFVYKISSE
ncbi:MAG TPA: hypothetical protein PKN75_02315 [Bacteroidia bacterium]|nr:hypothetical protein [Bacteroidia bacterium]HNU32409.1 hypothetical protein [Bacteroidia bacterium]